jgi:perosamine synthetase
MLSGWVGSSEATVLFEEEIKEITGAKHCISTTSGTTAIILALKSLNLCKGSRILFPAYTFLAGANACRFLGYEVQLVDVKPDTMCMNPEEVDRIISQGGIDCVMFVNHNAYVGEDIQLIRKICYDWGVYLFEDSSQALGMPNAGRTGKVGVFSFSVPKLVTTGQGGAIITDDDCVARNCCAWRDHGDNWRKTKVHNRIGGNFKFNDILAAYGLSQLQDIDQLLEYRRTIFDRYRLHLTLQDYGYDSTWMVLYSSPCANATIESLKDMGIQAVQYYKPIHHNPPFADGGKYPVAEDLYETTLYLPSSLTLEATEIDRICDEIIASEERAMV